MYDISRKRHVDGFGIRRGINMRFSLWSRLFALYLAVCCCSVFGQDHSHEQTDAMAGLDKLKNYFNDPGLDFFQLFSSQQLDLKRIETATGISIAPSHQNDATSQRKMKIALSAIGRAFFHYELSVLSQKDPDTIATGSVFLQRKGNVLSLELLGNQQSPLEISEDTESFVHHYDMNANRIETVQVPDARLVVSYKKSNGRIVVLDLERDVTFWYYWTR